MLNKSEMIFQEILARSQSKFLSPIYLKMKDLHALKGQILHSNPKKVVAEELIKVIINQTNNAGKIYPPVVNALISSALRKKSIKKSDLKWNKINTDSSAEFAMKTITTIYIVSFANRYTQQTVKTKMMTNGSAVITVTDG